MSFLLYRSLRRRGQTRRWLWVGALLALFLGTACAAPAPTATPTQAPSTTATPTVAPSPTPYVPSKSTLVVAHLFSVTQPEVFVGFQRGLFQRELTLGVTTDRRTYNDGTAMMAAFRNDEIDIAYVGSVPAVLSYAQKKNFRIVGGVNVGGTVLVARADKGIETVADLKGKTVAVPGLAANQDVFLRAVILKNAGLEASTDPDPNKVRIITSATAEMLAKLKEGSADAVITFEPWGARILADTSVPTKVLVDWQEVWQSGNYPSSVLIASTDLIQNHRDVLKRFLRAHVEAALLSQKDIPGTKQDMYDQFLSLRGIEEKMSIISAAYDRVRATYDPLVKNILEFQDLAYAVYPDRMPQASAISEAVDLSILNEVLREKSLAPIPVQ